MSSRTIGSQPATTRWTAARGEYLWTGDGGLSAAVPTVGGMTSTHASTAALLSGTRAETADRVIAAMAGPEARLREDQATAVGALCEPHARVLVVQATGWGKSAVYWAATAVRRSEGAGPTRSRTSRRCWRS